MTTPVNPLSLMAASPSMSQTKSTKEGGGTWFEAMARAWGEALDNQAATIQQNSDAISNGGADTPQAITELTAQSLKMGFLSTSSHTSISTVGEALKTMAQKQ
jgi:hypothetical protein